MVRLRSTCWLCLSLLAGLSGPAGLLAGEAAPLPRADGYQGCWYSIGKTDDEYKFKYSGGMATYPPVHRPRGGGTRKRFFESAFGLGFASWL